MIRDDIDPDPVIDEHRAEHARRLEDVEQFVGAACGIVTDLVRHGLTLTVLHLDAVARTLDLAVHELPAERRDPLTPTGRALLEVARDALAPCRPVETWIPPERDLLRVVLAHPGPGLTVTVRPT